MKTSPAHRIPQLAPQPSFTSTVHALGIIRQASNNTHACLFVKESDRWVLPGSHIEPGETPKEAALRGAQKKTGLEIERNANLLSIFAGQNNFFHVYEIPIYCGELTKGTQHGITDRAFFAPNQINRHRRQIDLAHLQIILAVYTRGTFGIVSEGLILSHFPIDGKLSFKKKGRS